jgi:hypothetical protein
VGAIAMFSIPVHEKQLPGHLNVRLARVWPQILAICVAVVATGIAVTFAGEPLLEAFGLRQTHTALTAYWMIHEGWKLAYETPVLGYPWSIPVEFPIYQTLAAFISWVGNFPLDNTGRLLSLCFLIACAWPALMIVRRLDLPDYTAWIFCALFWSSPLYLFYSRTFLMETTALFFTLAAVPYALDLRDPKASKSTTLLFIFFATLALLQKVTTAAPVMMVMGLVVLAAHARESRITLPLLLRLLPAFGVPVVAEMMWAGYSDIVRAHNAYSNLTFTSLRTWVFGTFEQRTNLRFLKAIFWNRMICRDTLGPLGLLPLAGALIWAEKRVVVILLVNIALFVLPVFIFTNLQAAHDYYQTECAIFLISAVSIAIAVWLPKIGWPAIAPVTTTVFVMLNYLTFSHTFANYLTKSLDATNTTVLGVSDVIRRYTPRDSAIVVYGLDWSATIPYYSERKALAAPRDEYIYLEKSNKTQYKSYAAAWRNPESFLGGKKLGAIVFCPSDELTLDRMLDQPDVKRHPALFKIQSCYINLPGVKSIVTSDGNRVFPGIPLDPLLDRAPQRYAKTSDMDCADSIDQVNDKFFETPKGDLPPEEIGVPGLLLVKGRILRSEGNGSVSGDAFMTLRSPAGVMKYIALKRVPRTATNSSMLESCPTYCNLFEATPDMHSLNGEYSLGLARGDGDTLRFCKGISIPLKIGSVAVH